MLCVTCRYFFIMTDIDDGFCISQKGSISIYVLIREGKTLCPFLRELSEKYETHTYS